MKYFYSAAALMATAVSAQSPNDVCAGAILLTDGVGVNSTFSNSTTNDARGAAACTTNYNRDQYYTYVATCDGSGLVSVSGTANAARISTAVFADPLCTSAGLSSVASGANSYVLTDMEVCTTPSRETKRGDGTTDTSTRFQFIAVTGTTYLIAMGTQSSDPADPDLDGEFDYNINVGCAPAASANLAEPTVVTAGLMAFSNVGGVASTDCTNANNVFFTYNSVCSGNVEFALVPPPRGFDGFNGEDLKIAVYQNAAQLGLDESLACQDDPAIITNNITAGAVVGPRGGALTDPPFMQGTVLVVVGSYSSAVAPFMLEVSEMDCGDSSPAASMGPSVLAMAFAMVLAMIK